MMSKWNKLRYADLRASMPKCRRSRGRLQKQRPSGFWRQNKRRGTAVNAHHGALLLL